MVGTTSFSGEDTERLALHAFKGTHPLPQRDSFYIELTGMAGTSASAVRQRANKLRVEHRALYEAHGWPTPDGKPAVKTPGAPKTPGTPKSKKRVAKDADVETALESPTKKGKKGAKVKDEDEPSNDLGGSIKAEDIEI